MIKHVFAAAKVLAAASRLIYAGLLLYCLVRPSSKTSCKIKNR